MLGPSALAGSGLRVLLLSLRLALIAAASSATATVAVAAESPPNIVLIIGDDVGWTDFGFMGSKLVRTPNLDRLAAEGTVFTHAFAPDSVCRPTLRSLLTGLTPQTIEALLERARTPKYPRVSIRDVVETLPEKLSARGYATFQGGKHWEGTFEDAGFTHGMTRTTSPPIHEDGTREKPSLVWASGSEGLVLGRETMQPLFDFLDAHRDGPFFVWYAPKLPHLPFDAGPEFREMYAKADAPPYVRAYRANMTRFDATVGALMAHLESLGLVEKTLVVYLSDNGWDSSTSSGVTGGPKGKNTLYELGVRTPLVFSWPGHLAAGARDGRLVSLLDLFPTLVDFAGGTPERVGGRSLHALLTRGGAFHREVVVGGEGLKGRESRFLRTEKWRYISDSQEKESLYLIESDPLEENDLASAHPELVRALREELLRELGQAAQGLRHGKKRPASQ